MAAQQLLQARSSLVEPPLQPLIELAEAVHRLTEERREAQETSQVLQHRSALQSKLKAFDDMITAGGLPQNAPPEVVSFAAVALEQAFRHIAGFPGT